MIGYVGAVLRDIFLRPCVPPSIYYLVTRPYIPVIPVQYTGAIADNSILAFVIFFFRRAQGVLRKAVTTAQGSAVKIRVSSAVAQVTSTNSSSPTISADEQQHRQQHLSSQQQQQEAQLDSRRKRTPPPLPPKPKLQPYDLEAMLSRANNEASMDYTPDAVNSLNGDADNLYTYGSFRRPGRKLTIDLLKGPEGTFSWDSTSCLRSIGSVTGEPSTCPIPNTSITVTIKLLNDVVQSGLGFTVTTRDNSAGVICPIYVKR